MSAPRKLVAGAATLAVAGSILAAAPAPEASAASRAHVTLTNNSQHYVLVSTCDRDKNSRCAMRVLYPGQSSPAGYYWMRVTPGYKAQRIGGHRTIYASGYEDSRFIVLSSRYGVFKR